MPSSNPEPSCNTSIDGQSSNRRMQSAHWMACFSAIAVAFAPNVFDVSHSNGQAEASSTVARYLRPGVSLDSLRAFMRSSGALREVYAEEVVIPRTRQIAGMHGRMPAMVVFDNNANHERMILFRRVGSSITIRHLINNGRESYSYRDVFLDAQYTRQYAELEGIAKRFTGNDHDVYDDESGKLKIDDAGLYTDDGRGPVFFIINDTRFRIRLDAEAAGTSYAPIKSFMSRDQVRMAYTATPAKIPLLFRLERYQIRDEIGFKVVGTDFPESLGF